MAEPGSPNGNEPLGTGEIGIEKNIPAHLYFGFTDTDFAWMSFFTSSNQQGVSNA